MKTNGTGWLRPAIQKVEATDPQTFARMKAAPWRVSVMASADELFQTLTAQGMQAEEAEEARYAFDTDNGGGVFGVTLLANPRFARLGKAEPLHGQTFINRKYAEDISVKLGVSVVNLAAMILVHEFAHYEGDGEPEAYAKGSEFAVKLPDYGIYEISEIAAQQQALDDLMAELTGAR